MRHALGLAGLLLLLPSCASLQQPPAFHGQVTPSTPQASATSGPRDEVGLLGLHGAIDLQVGVQDADDSGLDNFGLDEPVGAEFRLAFDLVEDGWFAFDLGIGGGADESTGTITVLGQTITDEVDARYGEFSFGATVGPRFEPGGDAFRLQPYVGAGVALIDVESSFDLGVGDLVDGDDAIGFYLRYGFAFEFEGGLRLGAEYRSVQAESVELFGNRFDFDYDRIAAVVGYRF